MNIQQTTFVKLFKQKHAWCYVKSCQGWRLVCHVRSNNRYSGAGVDTSWKWWRCSWKLADMSILAYIQRQYNLNAPGVLKFFDSKQIHFSLIITQREKDTGLFRQWEMSKGNFLYSTNGLIIKTSISNLNIIKKIRGN